MIALPSSTTHPGGCLTGQAEVVRSFTLLTETRESVFAVCFNECRLERRQSVHAAAAQS
jgi:hypothetical protein